MDPVQLFTRRDTLIAVACVTGGGLLLSLRVYSTPPPQLTFLPMWWLLVSLAIIGIGELFRRSSPVTCLAIGTVAFVLDVATGPSLGVPLIYTDALYVATVYGPRKLTRPLLIGVTAITVLVATVTLIVTRDLAVLVVIPLQLGLVVVLPVLTGFDIRRYRELAAAERARSHELTRLAELDRQAAVTAERTRMARELHDVIANHLSAIAIQSTAALSVPGLSTEAIRDLFQVIRQSSNDGLAEMKEMIYLLRDSNSVAGPAPTPRIDDVQKLLDQATAAGTQATLKITGEQRLLPVAVDLAAYRIVQESLTNAVKHGGDTASVRLDYQPESLVITVESPLRDTVSAIRGSGAGLVGMAERVDAVGGQFSAGADGDRWRVRAELPERTEGAR
jgi:signal transduction histidine kinase